MSKAPRPILVLVHTSSLDALTAFNPEQAQGLAHRLVLAVAQRPCPWTRIVHVDAGWPYTPDSALRRMFDGALVHASAPVVRIRHDEEAMDDPWGADFEPVLDELASHRPRRIDVAGLWASKGCVSGCVCAAHELISARFPKASVAILPALCGFEEWA